MFNLNTNHFGEPVVRFGGCFEAFWFDVDLIENNFYKILFSFAVAQLQKNLTNGGKSAIL